MPAPRARQIILTAAERRRLGKLAHSHTAGYQQVIRARIVLDAARGHSNAEISGAAAWSLTPSACGAADTPMRARRDWLAGADPDGRRDRGRAARTSPARSPARSGWPHPGEMRPLPLG